METNIGRIRTNEDCIGCNRCVTHCPVTASNVSVMRNGCQRIEVDDDKCVHCGMCITVCPHEAREYRDDLDAFLADLSAGQSIALAVDPLVFLADPEGAEHCLGYLQMLGAGAVYDVSFGADICLWATVRFLQSHPRKGVIASFCPVVAELVEKDFPETLDALLPVMSPLMCLAIYIKKYGRNPSPLAYIGPCVGKAQESADESTPTKVSYYIDYSHLIWRLAEVDTSKYSARPVLESPDMGFLFAVSNGMKSALELFLPENCDIRNIDSLNRYTPEELAAFFDSFREIKGKPDLLFLWSCRYGCEGALGNWTTMVESQSALAEKQANLRLRLEGLSQEERIATLEAVFIDLNPADFNRHFVNRYRQPYQLPADVLEEIFQSMRKLDFASRTINCGHCGYATCKAMAWAIAYGIRPVTDCAHYTRDETLRLYYTDPLTGIPNWNAFKRDMAALLWEKPKTRFTIAFFDIKQFRMINDLYGYDTGDQILKTVANQLADFAKYLGPYCRIRGDHFILCMPDSLENIREIINYSKISTEAMTMDFPVAFDFGFYTIDDPDEPVERMMDYARMAQLTVKGSYDTRWAYYDATMRTRMEKEEWITRNMKRALDTGQFHVYLQPKYDHESRRMVGAEALARWCHPEKGMISPGDFIPVLEKNHFINQLDAFIWESVCGLIRGWLDEGLQVVPVSVNLSRIDLLDDALVENLTSLVNRYRLPCELLELEITESAYSENPEKLTQICKALRDVGFTVAMDDFGSGYSSLNTLYAIPLDVVKLDMQFMAGFQDEKGQSIIQAVIHMMHLLGISVVIEGVETKEQADYLAAIGCPVIQGYYYARPMPVDDFLLEMTLDQ